MHAAIVALFLHLNSHGLLLGQLSLSQHLGEGELLLLHELDLVPAGAPFSPLDLQHSFTVRQAPHIHNDLVQWAEDSLRCRNINRCLLFRCLGPFRDVPQSAFQVADMSTAFKLKSPDPNGLGPACRLLLRRHQVVLRL